MRLIFKKILFVFILVVLSLPFLEYALNFINEQRLSGSFVLAKREKLTAENWFNGKYQASYEAFFNENFGFRNFFVKLNNQIQYSCFNSLDIKTVTAGKNGQLFQSDYIDSYLGKDFVGIDSVNLGIEKFKYVNNELKKIGTELLVLIAPGKVSFMPENLPDDVDLTKKDTTNYDAYIEAFQSTNINLIDLEAYFKEIKDSTRYPLFPPAGAHWSGYAITIVTDTVFKRLEQMLNIEILDFEDVGGTITTNLKETDNDLGCILNLLFSTDNNEMYYPKIEFKKQEHIDKPNVLIIGDSFGESFYRFYPFYKNCLGNNTHFWSYNIWEKYPKNNNKEKHRVKNYDKKIEFLSRDAIIIICTQINFKSLGDLFISKLNVFFQELNLDVEFQNLMKKLNNEASQHSMDSIERTKLIRSYLNKKYNVERKVILEYAINKDELNAVINKIKKNKKWFDKVKIQASKRGVSVDSMLFLSARHVIESRNNKKH